MSEQTAHTTGTEETNSQGAEGAKEFEAITSQEDFDKAIQARIARERAKFADYEQLKADAAELSKIRESQKSAEQRQQEALAAAQQELAELRIAKDRAEIAAEKGVPVGLLTGGTRDEIAAAADALIQFKGEAAPQRLHVPHEGKSPEKQPSSDAAFAKELFSRGD